MFINQENFEKRMHLSENSLGAKINSKQETIDESEIKLRGRGRGRPKKPKDFDDINLKKHMIKVHLNGECQEENSEEIKTDAVAVEKVGEQIMLIIILSLKTELLKTFSWPTMNLRRLTQSYPVLIIQQFLAMRQL